VLTGRVDAEALLAHAARARTAEVVRGPQQALALRSWQVVVDVADGQLVATRDGRQEEERDAALVAAGRGSGIGQRSEKTCERGLLALPGSSEERQQGREKRGWERALCTPRARPPRRRWPARTFVDARACLAQDDYDVALVIRPD